MNRGLLAFAPVALAACLGLFAAVSTTEAQQPVPRRIGVLLSAWLPEEKGPQALRQGLVDAGYAEGRDVVIEWRTANGDYDRLAQLAVDLVQSKVEVIVVDSTPATRALKHATSTIPIVMATVADPVGSGLVANLAHPGGNVTGLMIMTTDLAAKRLQLLKETIPRLTRIAVLWNPDTAYHPRVIELLKAAAPALSIELSFFGVRTPDEFGPAFSAISRAHSQALYVIDDALFLGHRTPLLKPA